MVSRKRGRAEMEAEDPPQEPTMLDKLRNMWEFANLMQYIYLFGDAVKIDADLDIEVLSPDQTNQGFTSRLHIQEMLIRYQELETECLKPQPSQRLPQIGLALLKNVSSHKGLTPEIFDEYTRRQYVAKAPQRNPFGTEESPFKFNDFDIFTKIRVLQQLSVWTLHNPNNIREKLGASEPDQILWRMEPLSWDAQERAYFVLDDSRLYRLTEPAPPPTPAKAKSKPKAKKARGTRSSKRRKVSTPELDSHENEDEDVPHIENGESVDNGLGGAKWECLCVTLEEYETFMVTIRKTRDPNEKVLYKRLDSEVLPSVIKNAEEQERKEARKLKELEVLQKLASAKRSSRISAKMEKRKGEEEAVEAERKRQADLAMAKAEQEKQRKMEEARESRMMTREQRLKDREIKRILHEEELKKLQENSENIEKIEGRLSERYIKAEMKRRQQELEKLAGEEEWVFDCSVCGLHGENLDDGSHSIQCEKCNVWQHSKCHGITVAQAERDDFHFICKECKRRAEEPKLSLKFRLTSSPKTAGFSASHGVSNTNTNGVPRPEHISAPRKLDSMQIPIAPTAPHSSPPRQPQPLMNGPSLSPRGQATGPPGIQRSEAAYGVPMNGVNGTSPSLNPRPYSSGHGANLPMNNGFPTSSPPQWQQSPRLPLPSPFNNHQNQLPPPQTNGSPYGAQNPFMRTAPHDPFVNSFSRQSHPSGSPVPNHHSPVKHSPAATPQQMKGYPNASAFTRSPSASFPPSSAQRPSFSPTKQSSPPMSPSQVSQQPHVPTSPAQILPNTQSGYSPEKHDGARPMSSHSFSETPILPPIKNLSPIASPQIMSPPLKKMTPERPRVERAPGANGGSSF